MAKKQIDRFVLVNIMGHKRYEGNIEGKHFFLIGKNGAGKSTILQRIKRLLGIEVPNPEKIITTGEEDGKAGLYTSVINGEKYYAEEKIGRGGKGRIYFYKENGARKDELKPAIQRISEVVGTPTDFSSLMDLSGFNQVQFFKQNLGLNLTAYELERENAYDDRTLVGREVVKAKAKLESPELRIYQADKDTYKEKKDTAEIIARKLRPDELLKEKQNIETFNTSRKNAADRHQKNLDDLEAMIKAMAELEEKISVGKAWLENNPEKIVSEIDAQILAIKTHNENIDKELIGVSEWNENVEKVNNYLATEKQYENEVRKQRELTKKINDLDNELFKTLSEFKLGDIVPGLELRYKRDEETGKVKESGLFLEGLPFHKSQHSLGKLLISIIKLSSYFNADKLNFVTIGEWNLLDGDNQKEVFDFVRANPDLNIQLGIEKVDNNADVITEVFEL